MKSSNSFVAISSEGGLLPADFLGELLAPKAVIDGLNPSSFNIAEGERLNEHVNRSWNRLIGRWADYKKAISVKQSGESTTTETRDRWLYPIFQELGFGQRLPLVQPLEIDGRQYAISHGWSHVPIHLVGSHADIDRRTPGAVGAAKASPHSLVQQLLNASESHLWGIVSNGHTFRLLRDNVALTRLSYVEWDLATIFDGELYSEFFILWLVAHQSRFKSEIPELCWLERWKKTAGEKGLRALESLYPGVKTAISALGAGLVSHRANVVLIRKLNKGELSTQDLYRQVLRIVYRLLFLLVAEDRGLMHPPSNTECSFQARRRYSDFYSITRLRALTLQRAGTPHSDLWHVFLLVAEKLGSDTGCSELALPALGSFLWRAEESTPDLNECIVSNRHFLEAVHALAFVQDGEVRRAVDYKNLGSEELGSVYQGLLEMHPQVNADAGTFVLDTVAGNERKTSGSYYTPDSLVQCLLDSALEPVIAERLAGAKTPSDKECALLSMKVCDPTVGSGHFILRAGHRIARHLARVRSGEEEPSPSAYRKALRDVIGRCLYGVDINPMSAELCRVSLWLEAMEPGKPLSFLDHHIRVGNSLVGATTRLIAGGIPDAAFNAVEGDDKAFCAMYKKRNKEERNQLHIDEWVTWERIESIPEAMAKLENVGDDTPEQVREKQRRYDEIVHSVDYVQGRILADAWCAAFVWKKHATESLPYPITNKILRSIERDPKSVEVSTPWLSDEIQRLAEQFQFFHWHLAFPEVFLNHTPHGGGGFDVVLGNPPWDVHELRDGEFFSGVSSDFMLAETSSARSRVLKTIEAEKPDIWDEYQTSLERYRRERSFMMNSGRFPFSARGSINLYKLVLEASHCMVTSSGRVGMVVPSSFVSDSSTSEHFIHLLRDGRLSTVYDFENRQRLFPEVDGRFKFALITIKGQPDRTSSSCNFVFWAHSVDDLRDPERRIRLSYAEMLELNPISATAPVFRSRKDLELTFAIHRRSRVLGVANEGGSLGFEQSVMIANDYLNKNAKTLSELDANGYCLRTGRFEGDESSYYPLYEGKLVGMYDHRSSRIITNPNNRVRKLQADELTEQEHEDPSILASPAFWVPDAIVKAKNFENRGWFLVTKDIGSATNERTVISGIVPTSGLSSTLIWLRAGNDPNALIGLLANLNSLPLDYIARQKLAGLHLRGQYIAQVPVIEPSKLLRATAWTNGLTLIEWIRERVLELSYTAWDLQAFGRDSGWLGPPFRWNEQRRFLIRCELDAAFFHLYLAADANGAWQAVEGESAEDFMRLRASFPAPRDAVVHIVGTFPIVKRKDESKYGHYRTKDSILSIYDAMQRATAGEPYQTRIDPPPGAPRDADGHVLSFAELDSEHWPPHIHLPQPELEAFVHPE